MGERLFDPTSLKPTHNLLKGARVRVEMKTRPHVYVWATVFSDSTAIARIPKEFVTDKYPSMRLFVAMSTFTVLLPQHEYAKITYDPYWRLFAFPNPDDETVVPIPKNKKNMVQSEL